MKPERVLARQVDTSDKPMISRRDLEALMERDVQPDSPVLSVYLNTDQSDAANIQRAFAVVFRNMLREVEGPDDKTKQEQLKNDAEKVLRFLDDYREPRRALVIFCDSSQDFFWVRELGVNVRNTLRWLDKPYVRPLLELMDEHERYGVVLTDRAHARLFTIFLGEIEEYTEAFADSDVTHIKTSGTDHLRSQMNIQRKADLHARWHLKEVAQTMSRLAGKLEFDRLILAGTVEATSELQRLLPKALRARVVGKVALPVEANISHVLEETLKIEREVERRRESDLVEQLITAAHKKQNAVVGLEDTLLALQEWRVWQLVYSEGLNLRGSQCTNCEALTASDEPCPYCSHAVRAVNDLIQFAAERVFDLEGKVEQVRGSAAARLKEVGSIGAVLHF
ncbi:MAG: peptide chain release factor subunit 1 [Acidimicrobiaceae bacterium]|jgi:peptide chain release factor subunit 1